MMRLQNEQSSRKIKEESLESIAKASYNTVFYRLLIPSAQAGSGGGMASEVQQSRLGLECPVQHGPT